MYRVRSLDPRLPRTSLSVSTLFFVGSPYTVSRTVLRIIVHSVYGVQRSTISGFAARSWTHVTNKIGKCSLGPDLTWIPAIANLYATATISRITAMLRVQAAREHVPKYLVLRS